MYASPEYGSNIIYALIAAGVSVVVTFVMTLIFGWDDPKEAEEALAGKDRADRGAFTGRDKTSSGALKEFAITSPVTGGMIPHSEVKDETFASGMLGQGIAIKPAVGKVIAPFECPGQCSVRFPKMYDREYSLLQVISPSGNTMDITMDDEFRITQIVQPDGGTWTYEYDEAGDLVSVTSPAGNERRYEYDDSHAMTAWYDENGNCITKNDYEPTEGKDTYCL